MRRRQRLAFLVVAVSMIGTSAVHAADGILPQAPYQPPLEGARVVHVGGGDLRNEIVSDLEVQFMAFYPETMKVHRGDTVEWRFTPGFAGIHTVTFLPADMDVAAAPDPLESAHRPMLRTEELPGHIAISEEVLLGTGCGLVIADAGGGRAAQEPCHIDSTGERYGSQLSDALLNFGARQPQGFAAVVDLPAGTYRYHCNFHPGMHGYIEVVDDEVPLPSQEEIDHQARAEIASDLQTAVELHRLHSEPESSLVGDQRVWTVHAGARSDDGRVSINDYMPAELELAPGDGVRFVHSGVEPHTVTFPSESVGSFTLQGCDMSSCEGDLVPLGLAITAAPFACEYDDPSTGSPGLPTFVPAVGCPAGGQIEWQLGPVLNGGQAAPGDLVASEATFHNSGWMAAPEGVVPGWYRDRPGGGEFPSTFDAVFPRESTFTYSCLIHTGKSPSEPVTGPSRTGMIGTVTVASP